MSSGRRVRVASALPRLLSQVTALLQQATATMERLNGLEGRVDRLEREAGDDRRAFSDLQAYVRAMAERTDLRFDQLTATVASTEEKLIKIVSQGKEDLQAGLDRANQATPPAVTAVLLALTSLFGLGFLTMLGWVVAHLISRWVGG